jgi:hypothetical protein
MNCPEKDVDRIVKLLPNEWLGQVHALLHVAAGLESGLTVGSDI